MVPLRPLVNGQFGHRHQTGAQWGDITLNVEFLSLKENGKFY